MKNITIDQLFKKLDNKLLIFFKVIENKIFLFNYNFKN